MMTLLTVAVLVAVVGMALVVVDAVVSKLDNADRKAGRSMSGTGCGFKGSKGGFNGRLLF